MVLVSTVLTNVKTCFIVLVDTLIIHSPCLKHEKQYLYKYIFVAPPLIKTPRFLILDTSVGFRLTIRPPQHTHTHTNTNTHTHTYTHTHTHTLIWHCEENVFQNRGGPCNYLV